MAIFSIGPAYTSFNSQPCITLMQVFHVDVAPVMLFHRVDHTFVSVALYIYCHANQLPFWVMSPWQIKQLFTWKNKNI